MPLVEVIHPEGAFSADAKKMLLETLSATCLRWEGVEVNNTTQSVAWVYLDERPQESIKRMDVPIESRPRLDVALV